MKKQLIICAMLALTGVANAQTPGAHESSWESNDNNQNRVVSKQGNEFAGTEITFREGEVIFSGLPELTKQAWAIVTNSEGDFIKQMKISPQSNVLNVRDLHPGKLYFVTIMYKNKSKKAFTLNM